MLIAIPSKGRPTEVRSLAVIPSATVFVPNAEFDDYRRAGVKNVVGLPNGVKGITATRNWILDNADDRWVVMVDDDVKTQGWIRLFEFNGRHQAMIEADWVGECVRLFEITEGMRYRIWGVATDGALRSVYPWKPILFRSYVTGSFMGVVNDGRARFDERFPVKEDYELCLRCIKEDGGVVAARYLYWANSHWGDPGGCSGYRTQLVELRAIKMLAAMYPGMIRKIVRGGSSYSIALEF